MTRSTDASLRTPFLSTARLSWLLVMAASLALTACGGGGGGGGGNKNTAPTASFTVNPSSGTVPLAVSVDGSASSDREGAIASYAWDFGDGGSASGVTAAHTYTTAGSYTIRLTVRDSAGLTGSTTRSVTVSGTPQTSVTISGTITFDRVPFSATLGGGLSYANTVARPAREITVQLLKASDQSVLVATTTDTLGQYSFSAQPINTDVIVRARAESISTGTPGWSISVKNNANSNALYVLDSAQFNTGTADVTKNLRATSGWNGTSYTASQRTAAPFAVLDSLYAATKFVVTQGDATLVLPALEAFWSPLNKSSDTWNPANGSIQTTLYRPTAEGGFPAGIYVLGNDGVDTDEYDEHVMIHEYNHFLQDKVSRDDTPGGTHSLSDKQDLRLAFSEGLADAFSGMPLSDPLYRDSSGSKQASEFNFNVESNAASPAGWFNEMSVASIVWDLFDSASDSVDTATVPFSQILDVERNVLKPGTPVTSLFPFVVGVKNRVPGQVTTINDIVSAQSIVANTMNAFATTESNNGGISDVLPVYTAVTVNGGAVTVCGNTTAGTVNKIGNRRFLTFSLPIATAVNIQLQYTATGSTSPFTPAADPDFVLYKAGEIARSESQGDESYSNALAAGDYVMEVYEYSHIDDNPQNGRRGRTCMNVTITG